MRVVALSNDKDSNGTAIRMGIPLRILVAQHQAEIRLISFHQCTRADLRWGDVFIIQRAISERMLNIMGRLKEMGKPVIYEIDDLLTQLPKFLSDHQTMIEQQDLVIKMIKMADAITVTTPRLSEQLAVFNPNIHLVPNFATDADCALAKHLDKDAPRATLVLASSDTVQTDFLLPAIHDVYTQYGSSVELVCIGAIADKFDIPGLIIHKYPIVPQTSFIGLIASFTNPIGLIPLDNSLFSSCKSAIKYLDYSMAGIPVICSNVSPYRDVIVDQQTGLLVENDPVVWHHAIRSLIESMANRERLNSNALAHIRTHHNVSHTVQAWQHILAIVYKGQQKRRSRTPLESMQDAGFHIGERFMVLLKDINRARLNRRKSAKARVQAAPCDQKRPN